MDTFATPSDPIQMLTGQVSASTRVKKNPKQKYEPNIFCASETDSRSLGSQRVAATYGSYGGAIMVGSGAQRADWKEKKSNVILVAHVHNMSNKRKKKVG